MNIQINPAFFELEGEWAKLLDQDVLYIRGQIKCLVLLYGTDEFQYYPFFNCELNNLFLGRFEEYNIKAQQYHLIHPKFVFGKFEGAEAFKKKLAEGLYLTWKNSELGQIILGRISGNKDGVLESINTLLNLKSDIDVNKVEQMVIQYYENFLRENNNLNYSLGLPNLLLSDLMKNHLKI